MRITETSNSSEPADAVKLHSPQGGNVDVDAEADHCVWHPSGSLLLSRQQFRRILCPFLRIGVNEQFLSPSESGWVKSDQIREYFSYVGIQPSSLVAKALVRGAESASRTKNASDKLPGWINLCEFSGTAFDHGASSGIFHVATNHEQVRPPINVPLEDETLIDHHRYQLLVQCSRDGEYLDGIDLAHAARKFYRCPFKRSFSLVFGTSFQHLEFATLLTVFGRRNNQGKLCFSLADIQSIFRDNRLPSDWLPPKRIAYGSYTVFKAFLRSIYYRLHRRRSLYKSTSE